MNENDCLDEFFNDTRRNMDSISDKNCSKTSTNESKKVSPVKMKVNKVCEWKMYLFFNSKFDVSGS